MTEPKILNLSEMFELDNILHNYVDKDYPKNAIDFVESILEKVKVNPVDYLRCVSILTGLPVGEMKKEDFMEYLTCFVQGLSMNKYLDFMDVPKKLGFA